MRVTRRARREARRLFRTCMVAAHDADQGLAGERLHESRAREVVHRVVLAGRRGRLGVLSHFRRLVSLDQERNRALVESATPLPADLRARVEAGVVRAYGPAVSTSFEENPALIAGMRVKVGSDVYDGSVRAALASLANRFR
jgi:F-type H+-transporting ATPase subunit delta